MAAVAQVNALVDTSGMTTVYSDGFDNPGYWSNPQGNWQIDSLSGWGTGNVAYIGSNYVTHKNTPQNLISSPAYPIDLTGYNTVLLQFNTSVMSTRRGSQQENVILTDSHGVQHIIWAKSKATFSGTQQVDVSSYAAGNSSINLTFQYMKKGGPVQNSKWDVDDVLVLGSVTKTYSTIQFNSSAYTVTEGNGAYAVLNLTCTPASTGTVTVNWTANDGTALAGVNYGIPGDNNAFDVNGTVTFNPGEANKPIQVPILDDNIYSNPDLSFNVSIEDVTDASGHTISGSPDVAQVTINDADSTSLPIVSIVPTSSEINEGSAWSGTGSFTDPGAGTSWSATVDYGDGSSAQTLALNPDKTFALDHIYADSGLYTVTVTVTNNNGISGSAYTSVTVDNVDPTANAGSDQTVNEGDTVSFSGSATDPGTLDTLTYSWDFGDSSPVGSGASPTHVYTDEGIYTVTLTVTDKDGGVGTSTCMVTVNAIPPTLTLSGAGSVDAGATYALTLSSTEHGSDTISSWSVNWGDGNVQAVAGSLSSADHVYAVPGVYTISATATDEDGTYNAGNTVAVHVNTAIVAYTIPLVQGWNLVSFPVVNNTLKASDLAGTGVLIVASYNPSTGDYNAYNTVSSPSQYDISMSTDVGYFVYCTEATSIVVYGSNPSGRSVTIDPGWNLIGWSSFTSSTAKAVCNQPSLADRQIVAKYNTATGDYDAYAEGSSPDEYDFAMHDGEGYFVYSMSSIPQTLYFEAI